MKNTYQTFLDNLTSQLYLIYIKDFDIMIS